MFKKSRRKIVVGIMTVLVVLWGSTLGVVLGSSYIEMSKRTNSMMKVYAERYELGEDGQNKQESAPEFVDESPIFHLSTFYSVAISDSGVVLEIHNDEPHIHKNEDLQQLGMYIWQRGRQSGVKNSMFFYTAQNDGYTLVVFTDNAFIKQNVFTMLRYTLIFGLADLLVLFFIAVYFAKRTVGPLEKNYYKQKQFVSDAGHELKTPVSVVSANAELLSREIGNNKWLENIQHENERMGVLVGQLLDLARAESGNMLIENIDFSRLCNGEALPFESVAYENGVRIVNNVAKGVLVKGNSTQLKQVVSILLDNAICHGTGDKVYLNLSADHKKARLSIVNKGDAFTNEQKLKLFERFYRLDTTRNSEDNHYGLGLAIAKSIVEAHKGTVDVLCYDGNIEFVVELGIISDNK